MKVLMAGGRLKKKGEEAGDVVVIQVQLEGEEARRFTDYKTKQFLRANSEAGRKLLLERLTEIEKDEPAA
jgi:hypothetical protein